MKTCNIIESGLDLIRLLHVGMALAEVIHLRINSGTTILQHCILRIHHDEEEHEHNSYHNDHGQHGIHPAIIRHIIERIGDFRIIQCLLDIIHIRYIDDITLSVLAIPLEVIGDRTGRHFCILMNFCRENISIFDCLTEIPIAYIRGSGRRGNVPESNHDENDQEVGPKASCFLHYLSSQSNSTIPM